MIYQGSNPCVSPCSTGTALCAARRWAQPLGMAPVLQTRTGEGETTAEHWSMMEKSSGVALQKEPGKTQGRDDVRGGRLRAGCCQDKIPNPKFPSQQLWQTGNPGAHSWVSPSPATGKTYWFELLLMGIKSELKLLAWCSQPSPYTHAGVAHNTFPLNKHLLKLPPWDPDLGWGGHPWAESASARSALLVICL